MVNVYSKFRDVYRLGDHCATAGGKNQDCRVELQQPGSGSAKRQVAQVPSLVRPVCHSHDDGEGSRDRCALKVLGLSRSVFGERLNRHVEARETREAAENEKREDDGIQERTKAESEGTRSRGHAKGDQICEGIKLLSHQGALLPPASHLPIHKVKEESEWHESHGEPKLGEVVRATKTVSQ